MRKMHAETGCVNSALEIIKQFHHLLSLVSQHKQKAWEEEEVSSLVYTQKISTFVQSIEL